MQTFCSFSLQVFYTPVFLLLSSRFCYVECSFPSAPVLVLFASSSRCGPRPSATLLHRGDSIAGPLWATCSAISLYIFFPPEFKQSCKVITIILICKWENNHWKLKGFWTQLWSLAWTFNHHHAGFPWGLLHQTNHTSPKPTLSLDIVFCLVRCVLCLAVSHVLLSCHVLERLTLLWSSFSVFFSSHWAMPRRLYMLSFGVFYLFNDVQEQVMIPPSSYI